MRSGALLFGFLHFTIGAIPAFSHEFRDSHGVVVVSDHPYCELDTSSDVVCPPGTALIRVWAPPTHTILINDHPTKPQTWTGEFEGSRLYLLTGVHPVRESEIVVRALDGMSEERCRHWVRSEHCYRMVFSKPNRQRPHHHRRRSKARHSGESRHSVPQVSHGKHGHSHRPRNPHEKGKNQGHDKKLKSISELIEDAKGAMKAGNSAITASQSKLDRSQKQLAAEMVGLRNTALELKTLASVLTKRLTQQGEWLKELEETTAELKKLVHRGPTHYKIVSPKPLQGRLNFQNNFVHSIGMTNPPAQLILQDKNQWIDHEVAETGTLKLKLYLDVLRSGQRERIEIRAGSQPMTIAVSLTSVGQDHRIGVVSFPAVQNWINDSLSKVAGETDARFRVVSSDTGENLILKAEFQLGGGKAKPLSDIVIDLR